MSFLDFNPTLAKDNRRHGYAVMGGVSTAVLFGNTITGNFRAKLVERPGNPGRRLVEEFVNCPQDPRSVFAFVGQNGPLDDAPVPNAKFTLDVKGFTEAQDELRAMWRSGGELLNLTAAQVRFSRGTVTYFARNLRSFLEFDLRAAPPKRLKVCERRECIHPYFIAGDLKRKFCSVECSEESKRESQRKWRLKQRQAKAATRESLKKERVQNGT